MAEVENPVFSIIEKEIPEGRKALRDGHENLAKVANYCQQKYLDSSNKYKGAPDKKKIQEETRAVLDETKQFATQSLASVAYQINTLAVNMLNLLDHQVSQLQTMESRINHISETVNIHKEKVARREVGVLATSKNTSRTHKIIAPAKQEKPERYSRKPIDYTILDDVGHGVKIVPSDQRRRSSAKKKPPSNPVPSVPGSMRAKPVGGRIGLATNIKPPPPPVPPPMPPSLPPGSDMYESMEAISQTPAAPAPPPPAVVTAKPVVVHPPAPPPPPIGAMSPSPPPPPPLIEPGADIPPPDMLPPPDFGGPGCDYEAMHDFVIPPPAFEENEIYEAPPDVMSPPPPPPPTEDFYSMPSSLPMPSPPEDLYDSPATLPSPVMPPPPPLEVEGGVPSEYIEKVMALYDYSATRDDELTFAENTVIYIIKKNDDGWYEGVTVEGETGLFPGNYVEACL